jgi:hypothetical protein
MSSFRTCVAITFAAVLLSGCAQSALTRSGVVSSYAGMTESSGILTRASFRSDHARLRAARSIRIVPAVLGSGVLDRGLKANEIALVTNAIDRTLCARLAERFAIIGGNRPADLTVRVTITDIAPTNATVAGISSAIGIGGTVARAATGLPIAVPRLPFGLGSLAVEAEALDADQRSLAVLLWSRGADALTTRPRASAESDAYTMASQFGADLARLLVTGDDPLKLSIASLPTARSMGEFVGLPSAQSACKPFGRNPGITGFVGGMLGVPPGWLDGGATQGEVH